MPKIVDLTRTLTSNIPTYPGDPTFSAKPAFQFPHGDGARVHALHLGTHTGTHIDAPYHFYKNGKRINEVPLDWLIGRPVVIDISSLVRDTESFRIEWEHLAEYEEKFRQAGQGDKILLIRTGWDFESYSSPDYFLHPYFTGGVAAKLLEHGIRIFGVDTLNPDRTCLEPTLEEGEATENDPWALHHTILGSGGLIVENLAYLYEITDETPGKEWIVHFIPLKLGKLDGSPIRAYAIQQVGAVST
jgi:kynurenine formamidase